MAVPIILISRIPDSLGLDTRSSHRNRKLRHQIWIKSLKFLTNFALPHCLPLLSTNCLFFKLVRGDFLVYKLSEPPVLVLHVTNLVFVGSKNTVTKSTLPVAPPHKFVACSHSSIEEIEVLSAIPQEILIVASEFKPFLLVEPEATMRHRLVPRKDSFLRSHFGKKV